MELILNKSQIELNLVRVQVLLATFNGEKYIGELLESLLKQVEVKISLLVSDDGSTDQTISIIRSYTAKFADLTILDGPKKGASENFFHLINNAQGSFIALCDQDDIWLPQHLIKSINRIRSESKPALSFSGCQEFDSDQNKLRKIWPKHFPNRNILSLIAENYARGCTMVFNAQALEILKLKKPKQAIMHDWWILIVIFSIGCVRWSSDAEIFYRIHKMNTIGNDSKILTKIRKFSISLVRREWVPFNQINEIYEDFSEVMIKNHRANLKNWLHLASSNSVWKRLKLLVKPYRLRSDISLELPIRFLLFIQRGIGA